MLTDVLRKSLHNRVRKVVRGRGHSPSEEAETKMMWLVLRNVTADWTRPPVTWQAAKADTISRIERAEQVRRRVEPWWNTPSRGPILPGHSLRALFEVLGFMVRPDWLAETFAKS